MDRTELETVDQARALYQKIAGLLPKEILDFLIDHPDERFNGAAIVKHLGLGAHREVARATYLMGQIAAQHGLERPWTEGQLGYLMPRQQAALLRTAREQSGTEIST